jgi:steroid delta-isomerase-like uncharacterized protein
MNSSNLREAAVVAVLRYYEAFNAGDREAMLALLAEDVVHDINQGAREIGRAAFRIFLARMDRCYRERLEDLVVMASDDGLRAAAEFTVHGEYLAADEGLPPARGQRYLLPAGAFLALDAERRIARITTYYNLEEWLRQVR